MPKQTPDLPLSHDNSAPVLDCAGKVRVDGALTSPPYKALKSRASEEVWLSPTFCFQIRHQHAIKNKLHSL